MYDVGAIVGRIVLHDTYTGPLKKAEAASDKAGLTLNDLERKAKSLETQLKNTNIGTEKFDALNKELIETRKYIKDLTSDTKSLDTVFSALTVGALFAGFTASIIELSNAGAELEQTFVSYKTLLGGSAEATQELVGELNQLANITPYTNQEILKAGKQMLAFGARAEDVSEILTVVGDVASGTGKNFNELALIYGKAMTAGVVQAEELNQLTEAGIPIVKVLAEQFGVAESQVKKLGSEGKIGFKDLEKAFQSMTSEGGLFFNMMEEQSKTFGGTMSTLQGNVGSLASEIGMSLNEILLPSLQVLVSVTGDLLAFWQSLPEPVQQAVVVFGLMAGVTGTLAGGIIAATKAFGSATAALDTFNVMLRAVGIQARSTMAALTPLLALQALVITITILEVWKKTKDSERFDAEVERKKEAIKGISEEGQKSIESMIHALEALVNAYDKAISEGNQSVANTIRDQIEQFRQPIREATKNAAEFVDITQGSFNSVNFKEFINAFKSAKEELKKDVDPVKVNVDLGINKQKIHALAGDVEDEATSLAEQFARGWVAGLSNIGQRMAGPAMAEFLDPLNEAAESIGDGLQTVFDGFVDNMALGAELAVAKIEDTIAKVDFIGEVALTAAKKRHEEELAALEASENAKIQALRDAQVERFALIDEEFAKRKEQMDAEFALLLEQERMKFELRLLELEQRSADEEQARLARQVMEEDWRKYVESLQQQHTQNILDAETQKNDQIQAETQSNADAIAAAEQAKADAITKIKEEQAAKEQALEKQQLLVKSLLEYQAFQADKKAKLASAGISYAMAVMEAVRGGAALAASFPPFTIPLGLAFTASMIGLATGTYNMTRGIIAASNYTPPAALFAEEGGTIVGPRHSMGGVMVNAEGGETFLSRRLTADLEDYISDDRQFVPVTFAPGSIVVQGNMDASMVDRLATAIAARIEQRRY